MKKSLFIFLIIISQWLHGQTGYLNSKPIKVDVVDWGSLSIWIGNDFFNATRDSIVAQIGDEEFEWMKDHCTSRNWPKGMYDSSLDEEEDKKHMEKLNRLKKYKIASFQHIYNGMIFERYVILRVPYEDNKDWDPLVKWERSVYFLLNESDTREID